MNLFSKIEKFKDNYFSFLLAFLPISFVAGNMVVNINIILLILSSIYLYRTDFLKIKFFFLDKLFVLFFIFILFTGIYNDLYFIFFQNEFASWSGYFKTSIKSFLFVKYFLVYLTLRLLIEKGVIDLKIFFVSSTVVTLFVSLDLFYQLIFGRDIFGFETIGTGRKLGGPFNDELIAGGFIQRFSIFSFFLIPFFFKNNLTKYQKFISPILLIIFICAIIISGNRMPFILFVLSIFLLLYFQKNFLKRIILLITITSIVSVCTYKLNSEVRVNFLTFSTQVSKMIEITKNQNFKSNDAPLYLKEFVSFYDTWMINKFIGGGIKNFRYYCHVRPNVKKDYNFSCNMHPHNYYLEILTETGVFGFLIIITIFCSIFFICLKRFNFKKSNFSSNLVFPFFILFLIEIFPIRSSGSFFTTNNSTYLFLLIGIIVALIRKENLIEKKA